MPSFDVVSELNMQEVDNAINQAKKEISTRYDFRGSKSELNLDKEEIKILADDDYKLKAIKEIMEAKLIKRGVSLKSLDYQKEEEAAMGAIRQSAKLVKGITKEKGKEIIAHIKEMKTKAQAQIQDEQVRVTSKSIDELQSIMAGLKIKDVGIPLQFINMRS
jgi:uncharacterized protein YajQ (UPF0234 family)